MASQLYGISFLSLAVCDGAEYAVNERLFFLPGRLETFRWEWPACARLKTPEAKARHLFFDPEWVFNFGYPSVAEEEKRRGDKTMS